MREPRSHAAASAEAERRRSPSAVCLNGGARRANLELERGLARAPAVAHRTMKAEADDSARNRGACAFRGEDRIRVRTRDRLPPEAPARAALGGAVQQQHVAGREDQH